LTLGVRLVVSGRIEIADGAGIDIFSSTTSSSLDDDDESLESDKTCGIILLVCKSFT